VQGRELLFAGAFDQAGGEGRVAGKTVTETFPNPTALRKAQQEVTEFHRFQKLSQDLVALNEKICRLRPVEQQRGGWTEQEKKTLLRSMRKWREK